MKHDKLRNTMAFDSITEMATWANANINKDAFYRNSHNPSFFGSTNWDSLMGKCAMGDDSTVPEAQKLISKIESHFSGEVQQRFYDVAGDFPDVGLFLSGEPECMVSMERVRTNDAPLSIYIDMTTSAGITSEQYRKRGIAVLALAIQLSSSRPINLHVCCAMGSEGKTTEMMKGAENWSIVSARVETAPLDLGRAAMMLTDVSVPRRMFYATSTKYLGFQCGWPHFNGVDYGNVTCDAHMERVRDLLNIDGETLYIPPVCGYTGEALQMVERPVEWINKMLNKYGPAAVEE